MKDAEIRLLMVAPTAVPGGMEEIFFNLAIGLPSYGITPSVISLQTGPLVDRLVEHSAKVSVVDAGRLRDPGRFWRTVRQLAAAVRTERISAIFSNMSKAHVYVAPAVLRQRVPALWCQAGFPDPAHWIDRLATSLPTAGVIALSEDAAAAQRRLNARRPVHLLHPGIDVERFRIGRDVELRVRYGIPADATLVSLVGRLQPWKGQREFLVAAARLADLHPGTRFAIVGGAILGWEGDYPKELEKMASSLGLADRVTFTGHTTEVHRWMAASDIVVNASQPEPFGLVVVEAMASGCAVVAVATGGPRDIIEHGRSGLLCESRDPGHLAAAIERLLANPGLRIDLGRAGSARVNSHFSRQAMTERFTGIVRAATYAAAGRR